MAKKYRVLFYGLSGDKDLFKSQMVHLGAPPEAVHTIIQKAPVILKQGLTLEFSTRYADAVRKAGGIVDIQEYDCSEESENQSIAIASLKDFVMCPECGLKQPKGQTCIKCGFNLVKTKTGLEQKNAAGH